MSDKQQHPPLEEVQEFYKTPPIRLPGGTFGCPMPSCEHVADNPQAIGPHKTSHARFYGLAQKTGGSKAGVRRAPGNVRQRLDGSRMLAEPYVECPYPGCEKRVSRGHLKAHYRTVHHRSGSDARKACDPVLAATRVGNGGRRSVAIRHEVADLNEQRHAAEAVAKQVLPAVPDVDPPYLHPLGFPVVMSGTDIGLAVVMSQVNGSIPTDALPDVIAYIEHTRQIVDKLSAG